MYRKMFVFYSFVILVGVVGCWGTSAEIKNNPNQATFVPSPMPETGTPDPDPVRITDKSSQGTKLKAPTKTDDSVND